MTLTATLDLPLTLVLRYLGTLLLTSRYTPEPKSSGVCLLERNRHGPSRHRYLSNLLRIHVARAVAATLSRRRYR